MNAARTIVGLLVVAAFALGLAVRYDARPPSSAIVRAYGIVSPCGVYAVIVVRANGASEIYTAEHEADLSVEQEVIALPDAQRAAVLVPCAPSTPSGVIA